MKGLNICGWDKKQTGKKCNGQVKKVFVFAMCKVCPVPICVDGRTIPSYNCTPTPYYRATPLYNRSPPAYSCAPPLHLVFPQKGLS